MWGAVLVLLWWSLVPAIAQQLSLGPQRAPKVSKDRIFYAYGRLLLDDTLDSDTVRPGNTSRFCHLHGTNGPLTIIINPCNGIINSTLYYLPQTNSTSYLKDFIDNTTWEYIASEEGQSQHVYNWASTAGGLYLLDLTAEVGNISVNLYATKLPGVPAMLRIQQTPRLRVQPRLHRNRVTLRWDQSVVDPQLMHYYVVVSSRRNFTSLCEAMAQNESNGSHVIYITEKPYNLENKIHKKAIGDSDTFKTVGTGLREGDVLIASVRSGLSFTISSLQKGRDYYFNIFAMNRHTQLSFLYANAALKYDPKLHPMGLKDNKPVTVNIRKMGGRALFRYKVRAGTVARVLSWHVMPCRGSVLAEVRLRKQVVVPRVVVDGYRHLQVPNVRPGERYTLLVFVPNAQQMRQISGVEVVATMRTSLMPQLPTEAMVHEFTSMKTCTSVTIAWLPVTTQSVRYCVSASPVPIAESEAHFRPRPNQCNLDYRLRTQFDFSVKQCQDFSANDNRSVLVQTISKLRPGKEYLIQVTVKKIKGKALSYDLLRVRTKSIC